MQKEQMAKQLVLCLHSIGILILVKSRRETNFLLASQLMKLNPPEGTECEKRHIKSFDEPNVLAA